MSQLLFAVAAAITLLGTADPKESDPPTVPPSRGGADLVGKEFPDLTFDRWVNTEKGRPPAGRAVTLYRWWTNTCPYCAESLPAFEKLRRAYEEKGLRVVAVYHPKPPREVSDEQMRKSAALTGYRGIIALDQDWSELKRLWLSTGERRATSASFLVDARGVIRFVHPGPSLYPSDDPDAKQEDDDYRTLERAVRALLAEAEQTAKPTATG